MPVFLAAQLVVRAVPIVLYCRLIRPGRQLVSVGLMQATSLSIPVVAGAIGGRSRTHIGDQLRRTGGLLSVLVFPLLALRLLLPATPAAAMEPGHDPSVESVD